jgi:hypothetical protein
MYTDERLEECKRLVRLSNIAFIGAAICMSMSATLAVFLLVIVEWR